MNPERIKEWTNALRTTTRKQAEGVLCEHAGNSYAYCCLGIGERLRGRKPTEMIGEGMPTGAFVEWLGGDVGEWDMSELDDDDVADGDPRTWDLVIDWPEELLPVYSQRLNNSPHAYVTAASLNDDFHLTFKQIADVVDYFGLRSFEEG